jgi:hypothetical protein
MACAARPPLRHIGHGCAGFFPDAEKAVMTGLAVASHPLLAHMERMAEKHPARILRDVGDVAHLNGEGGQTKRQTKQDQWRDKTTFHGFLPKVYCTTIASLMPDKVCPVIVREDAKST